MAKSRYVCQNCGNVSAQWLGKCNACGTWNSMVEESLADAKADVRGHGAQIIENTLLAINKNKNRANNKPKPLSEITASADARWGTGMKELDRVLGGGAVAGAFVLIGGDPGIGKSTLLLQTLHSLSKGKKVLYITGEESAEQVKLRAARLGISGEGLLLAPETNLEKILQMVEESQPDVLAVDSIQTMYTNAVVSAPGSVSQVKETGARLMHLAKGGGILVVLVGHVTKDGSIAGPRVLEHMVDTVLYFEGSASHNYRILRAVKNRFGSTNEIGIFDMTEKGLQEVSNPSAMFLAERPKNAPGSVAITSMEGTRPVIVELQALVTKSFLSVPRRACLGVDGNRAALLLAVLEKKWELSLYERDVFVNVVGGLTLDEPGADLGIIAAVASSYFNQPIAETDLFIGEVGLAGEVRSVARLEDRIKEAATMGFKRCFVPKNNANELRQKSSGIIEVVPLQRASDLLELLFRK